MNRCVCVFSVDIMIKKFKPNLNVQTDSIRAKLFAVQLAFLFVIILITLCSA